VILTGPTGSGKSAIALELAEQFPIEIVAMDSMTHYRGMDIGTAKPTRAEQARVPHHLVDVLNPWESANVAWWLDQVATLCPAILARGRVPLLVGGTPFYLQALLSGLCEAPPASPEVRARLESEAQQTNPTLHERLASVDPISAARLHPNDHRRIIRALEVWELTGQPLASFQQTWRTAKFGNGDATSPGNRTLPCVALEWPRDELLARLEARTDAMFAAGWLDEVRRLMQLPEPLSPVAHQAVGYRELAEMLAGARTEASARERIQVRTRQLAKRQETWFRSLSGCIRIAGNLPNRTDFVRQALQLQKKNGVASFA
jgi:tRNA dimethylallyltransferase